MRTIARVPLPMLVPPPLLFVLAFLASLPLERLAPGPAAEPSRAMEILGFALLALGVLLGPGGALRFLVLRTTVLPHGEASRLVTSGPYRFTRNPMYLGITLGYLGIAALTANAWALPLLLVPLLILDRVVIPHEEATLRRIFGVEYEAYARRVRRWL